VKADECGCIYIWGRVISVAKKVGCLLESKRKCLKKDLDFVIDHCPDVEI